MQCNSENYGHFLCESAPKLIHLAKMGCRKARIIFPKNCMKYCSFTQKFLAYLGIESEPLTLDEGSSVCLQNVLYFTAVSKHNFRKSETLLEFRDVALSLTAERGARSRKLFITRAEGDRRRLSNQEATAFCLAEIGYDAVYPGNLSVLEQIQLFAQASHIVGSVGAGMTNMLFCPAGADVFYICNGLLDFFFWDIAGLCRQKFHWFFAQPLKVFDQETFVRNFTVNIGGLMSALEFTQA
jgi:capsular polysaccharide biosynthesis protein